MSVRTSSEPRILPRSGHSVSRKGISHNALKVLNRLDDKGYKGYLVGGSVRDLMLGIEAKDFDVGTDARPHEVKKLFRNSRIIGRRFRLVHVFFGPEIIEVSTFRRDPDPKHQDSPEGDLLITSDNTYGNPRQDAFRRDFTVNGLFYDISDRSVIDYVGGIEDLERGVIRVIGDPDVRMQEDPVRMMRACEFAGRLDFAIDPATRESIRRQRDEIELAAPARVTEEVIDFMRCGSATSVIDWMHELGLLEVLLPEAHVMIDSGSEAVGDFGRILPALDGIVEEGRTVSDSALLALLLLPGILARREDIEAVAREPMSRAALRQLVDEIAEPFVRRFQLSKNRTSQMHHALTGFLRLCEPSWTDQKRVQFTRRPYFEDAYRLFEIMVEATGEGREALETWRRAAEKGGRRREDAEGPRPVRRGRRRRRENRLRQGRSGRRKGRKGRREGTGRGEEAG